ncbi:hypothetical protein DCC85_13505 [Paenibacillus sp. CAA11]|uniref:YitT family protein n=1 Tax=Paenibacillus sp. CAA11 TaxID=1532905 RepID=UPI000D3A8552|nr:YitT family protein [Paenibacillus sp. CAA11]AWB45142.1 hypothetical protein DCC85_13505 [Paenibacillus sp. CAA11]
MRKEKKLIDVRQIGMILFGTFVLSFTYYHINFQNGLAEGGFVGMALLGKYLFNLPPGLTSFLLDLPVFAIAWFLKGRAFMVNTLIGSAAFSGFYELCERFSPLQFQFHHNLLLAALLSGVLTGIGAGLVLRYGGATGGDDILSLCLSQWSGLKIGTVFILLDAVVLGISLIYLPLMETLFTILAVSIAGKVITWTVSYGRKDLRPVRVPLAIDKKTARA